MLWCKSYWSSHFAFSPCSMEETRENWTYINYSHQVSKFSCPIKFSAGLCVQVCRFIGFVLNYLPNIYFTFYFYEYRYSLHVVDEQSGIDAIISRLQVSNQNLQLLVVGCKCSHLEGLTAFCGDKSVFLLTPVSLWTKSQTLQFVRKLNLLYLEDVDS